jgi:rRNA maturation protein Nop10
MKLITTWGVRSRCLDQLLKRDCPHCGGSTGRLVWHLAGPDPDNIEVWVSCMRCGSKLGNAQPHHEQRRMSSYPIWREDLGAEPTLEEIEEIILARSRSH